MDKNKLRLILGAAFLLLPSAAWAGFQNGQNASIVIGQPDFTSNNCSLTQPTQNGVCHIIAITFDSSGNLWAGDSGHGRVLRFSPPFSTNMNANLVLGATDFTTVPDSTSVSSGSINNTAGLAFDSSGDLWVIDAGYNRVLEFKPPFSNGMYASLVIGQQNFTSTAPALSQDGFNFGEQWSHISFDGSGNLWVADDLNSRVLRFSPPFSNGMNADLVIGSANFVSSASVCASNGFYDYADNPIGITFDSSGDLWVENDYKSIEFQPPFSNGMNASVVVGAPSLSTCYNGSPNTQNQGSGAEGLAFDANGNLWSAGWGSGFERVLGFTPPLSTGMNASVVLGQTDFAIPQVQALTQNGMISPVDVAYSSGSVWVAEMGGGLGSSSGGRVLRFDNVPSSATDLAVSGTPASSEVQLSWTATDNPYGVDSSGSYLIQYSTDSGTVFSTTTAQVNISTSDVPPLAVQGAAVSGLMSNTTYYFRLWSANVGLNYSPISNGATTETAAPLIQMNGPPLEAVYFTSATAQWAALPAAPSSATAEGYELEASSTDFDGSGTVYSSATADISLSTLTLSALAANATYYFRAGSLNWAGTANWLALGSTVTPVETPNDFGFAASASSQSVSLSWSGSSNSSHTPYEISASTDDFQANFSTPVAFGADLTATSAALSNLYAGTTYYFRVRAEGITGALTGFANVISTETLPGAVVLSTSSVGVSSISWSWSAGGTAVEDYQVYASSNGALLSSQSGTGFALTGLSTNTAYGIMAAGTDATGQGLLAASTIYTLAAPPAGTSAAAIYLSSATLSWSLDGNPSYTTADVERSTDDATFVSQESSATASFTDQNLLGCTTYYYRVRNLNGDDVPTIYDSTVSFETLSSTPTPPSGLLALSQSGNRIELSWTASPAPYVTDYLVFYDSGTGTVNYSQPLATLPASATSYTTPVLTSSAAYTFGLRATNGCVDSNTNVQAVAASTPSIGAVSADIAFPQSGMKVEGDRLTVLAGLAAGTPSQTKQVLFEYKASSSSVWLNIPAADSERPNPAVSLPYYVHWDLSSLTPSTYDLRAVATDSSGNADAAPSSIAVSVLASGDLGYDVNEYSLSGNTVEQDDGVSNAAGATLESGDGSSAQIAKLVIPAGVFSASSVTVSMVNNPSDVPSAPAYQFTTIGAAVHITLSNGQSLLSGGQTAVLTLSYPDADNDGIVDGTSVRASALQIYAYNSSEGRWTQDFSSTLDSVNHLVSGNTPHFSYFALMAPLAASLDTVRVYPNPYEPDGGNSDKGVPYTPGNSQSGIIFDQLPSNSSISIYTITGRLVRTLSGSGTIQWDARNGNGRDVATGGYVAVVSSPGLGSVIKKILIVR